MGVQQLPAPLAHQLLFFRGGQVKSHSLQGCHQFCDNAIQRLERCGKWKTHLNWRIVEISFSIDRNKRCAPCCDSKHPDQHHLLILLRRTFLLFENGNQDLPRPESFVEDWPKNWGALKYATIVARIGWKRFQKKGWTLYSIFPCSLDVLMMIVSGYNKPDGIYCLSWWPESSSNTLDLFPLSISDAEKVLLIFLSVVLFQMIVFFLFDNSLFEFVREKKKMISTSSFMQQPLML